MNIETIEMLFTVGVILYAVVMAVIGLLIARKRNWKLGIVRIGVTVAAAIGALPLSRMLARYAAELVYGLVEPRLGADLSTLIMASSIGVEGLMVLVTLIAAPVLFLTVFAALRGIGSIMVAILGTAIRPLRKKQNRALTWSLGAVNGVAIALVTLIPLCGFLMLGGRCLDTVAQSGVIGSDFVNENVLALLAISDEDMVQPEDLEALAERVESNPVLVVVNGTVGDSAFAYLTSGELILSDSRADTSGDTVAAPLPRPVFGSLAVTGGLSLVRPLTEAAPAQEADGETIEMNLEEELRSLIRTTGAVVQAIDCIQSGDFTEADKELLYAAAESILASDSRWVELLGTDALTSFAESWLAGEAYLGLERPDIDEELAPMLDCILQVLASESEETLMTDVHTVLDVVGDLLVYDVFEAGSDPTQMIQRLGQDGLLTSALDKLRDNPRLEVLATEVQSLGLRMVSKMLDVEKLKLGEHDALLARVAEECNKVLHLDPAERRETAARELAKVMNEHGFDVSEAIALELADKVIADLGDDNEVTVDELRAYLVDIAEGRVELPDEILPDAEL